MKDVPVDLGGNILHMDFVVLDNIPFDVVILCHFIPILGGVLHFYGSDVRFKIGGRRAFWP